MKRGATNLLLLVFAAACAAPASGGGVQALDGGPADPLHVGAGRVHVLVFTSHECPIANAYAPTLQQLALRWRHAAVDWFCVYVDPELTTDAARQHTIDYALPGRSLLDPHQTLARRLGITRTPEAAVLTPSGLGYRGRIDDQWRALGSRIPQASTADLSDAIGAALTGQTLAPPYPPAVGCLLPEPAPR